MCSCKLRSFNGTSHTVDSVMNDQSMVETISNNKLVSKECFANRHPLSWFQYLNCVAPQRFRALFTPYDIQLNSYQDIVNLAKINEQGIDIKQFKVNFMDLAKGLVLTQEELSKSDCIIFC